MRLTGWVIAGGLLAALAATPALGGEIGRDRRDVRQDRREIREDNRDIRQDRRELAGDRRELARDRPGHVEGTGHGLGSTAYVPSTDPREHEHDLFAHEIANMLDAGVASGRCAGLVLVASNHFLGQVKQHLGEAAQKLVLRTVPSDYTRLSERELAQRLSAG